MAITITANYVKFIRGTKAAYQGLASHDPDTLYFVYENKEATSGLLYLGDKLISGGGISNVTKLSDLEDILLSEGIGQDDILTYDTSLQKWVNTPLSDVLERIISVFTGATTSENGTSGLVPAPQAGDNNKFLKGDGTWAYTPGAEDIEDLRAVIATVVGEDTNKSMRQVSAEEVAKVVAEAPESFDTLKEIAEWIQKHPEDVAELNAKINELDRRVTANEGSIVSINSELEILSPKVASLETDLSNLTSRVTQNEGDILNLQTITEDLDARLKWWEIDTDI